jgi:hypothetical protein
MPFCPECRYEYIAGKTDCPDCGVKLVDKLPDEQQEPLPNDQAGLLRFVRLPELPRRIYAEMVRGALQEKGIPCYIQADRITGAYGLEGPVPTGAALWVPEDRLDECLGIQHGMLDHI